MAPQLFQVLRCFKCSVFQTHQVKKSIKWSCKMCGEKQSRKRNYGFGSGKDCRLQVQKLNGIRGEIDNTNIEIAEVDDDVEDDVEQKEVRPTVKTSKWSNYINNEVNVTSDNNDMCYEEKKIVLEIPKNNIKKVAKNKKFYKNVISDVQSSTGLDSLIVANQDPPKKKQKFVTPVKIPSESVTGSEENVLYLGFTDPENESKIQENSVEMFNKTPTLSCFNNKYLNDNSNNCKPSKWSKFENVEESCLENKQNVSEDCKDVSSNYMTNAKKIRTNENIQNLFSLCDDSDLDSVLSI